MANDLHAAAIISSVFRAIRLHPWSCRAVAIAIWCAIASAGTAGAQSIDSGTIHGTVEDNTGGALPGVTIALSGPTLLVKQIVDAHAGTIHVESDPSGTTVTVELPAAAP